MPMRALVYVWPGEEHKDGPEVVYFIASVSTTNRTRNHPTSLTPVVGLEGFINPLSIIDVPDDQLSEGPGRTEWLVASS